VKNYNLSKINTSPKNNINYSNHLKIGKNIINSTKSDTNHNISFKASESPSRLNKAKENWDKNTFKNKHNFQRFSISPDIKRKKKEFEMGDFKIDFKSKSLSYI